jgi:hypothetical protein
MRIWDGWRGTSTRLEWWIGVRTGCAINLSCSSQLTEIYMKVLLPPLPLPTPPPPTLFSSVFPYTRALKWMLKEMISECGLGCSARKKFRSGQWVTHHSGSTEGVELLDPLGYSQFEEFRLLGSTAMWTLLQPTFSRNLSPPSSGYKESAN